MLQVQRFRRAHRSALPAPRHFCHGSRVSAFLYTPLAYRLLFEPAPLGATTYPLLSFTVLTLVILQLWRRLYYVFPTCSLIGRTATTSLHTTHVYLARVAVFASAGDFFKFILLTILVLQAVSVVLKSQDVDSVLSRR